MDTGRLKGNTEFYDGFEGEGVITLSIDGRPEYYIEIWDGYMDGFFCNPPLDGKGWNGFTRDYNQCEGAFEGGDFLITNVKEYLDDMQVTAPKEYEDEASAKCYALLLDFLTFACENSYHINANYF